jgi:cation transport ATPase
MDKNRLRKFGPYLYLGAFIVISAVIFLFASFSGEVSTDQSNVFVEAITTFLGWFGFQLDAGAIGALSTIVRKLLGHFMIFLLDGVFAYLTIVSFFHFKRQLISFLWAALTMVLVASTSEIIQLFASGRAGQFVDVILDSAGAFIGILTSAWIRSAYRKKKETTI